MRLTKSHQVHIQSGHAQAFTQILLEHFSILGFLSKLCRIHARFLIQIISFNSCESL